MQQSRHQSHYVIDFQGFKANGEFRFQEFAAFDLQEKSVLHIFINQDVLLNEFDFSSYCCSKSLHKISKSFGSSKITRLVDFFSSNSEATFFVKGIDQCLILSNFCSNQIFNLDRIETDFYIDNKFHLQCSFQDHNLHVNFLFCSLKRACSFGFQLLDWFSL
jgi:hypothetical protein